MNSEREANLLRVLTDTTWQFYMWIGICSAVALWGLYGYLTQLRWGLAVTGLSNQNSWGLYIVNFVFFTGMSYGGTLISAILRVTHAGWRHPITRLAEGITVFALFVGGPMVMIDLGRPDRILNLFTHERIQSVILWDVVAVSTYLAGSILYLYLPMIPDLALLSKREELAAWRRKLYRALALGWTDSAEERRVLEKTISRMAVLMIMLAVSVHTVVSWIFAMTLRPGWNSSNFGAYFVMAAIYSGSAGVVLSMYLLRRVFHLEDYLKPIHFRNLGYLLITFSLLYLYFTINEYLTMAYKIEGAEKALMHQLFFGDFALLTWAVLAVCIFIPLLMIAGVVSLKRYEKFTPSVVALASVLIIIGAWGKRFLIVVPTLTVPYLSRTNTNIPFNPNPPFQWVHYRPSWVEWSITLGGVAIFLILYMLFTKLFPMVSIWETRLDEVQKEHAVAPPPQPAQRRWWRSTPIVLMACVLFGAGHTWAAQKGQAKKPPEAATMSQANHLAGERSLLERIA
jgi:Ni/Fe-hydrogenase subunit HybB-like protein